MLYKDRLTVIVVDRRIRLARKYSCERCGVVFYTRKNGVPKYCGDCRVIVYYENMAARKKKRKELCGAMKTSSVKLPCDGNLMAARSKRFT